MATIPRGTLVFDHDTDWVWVAPDGTVLTPPSGSPTPVTHDAGRLVVTDIAGDFQLTFGTFGPTHYHEQSYSAQLVANFDLDEGNRRGNSAVALGVEGSFFNVLNGSTFTDPTHTFIRRINSTTGATITQWSLAYGGTADDYRSFAVAPDGLTAYGGKGTAGIRYLYKVDLSGAGSEVVFKDDGTNLTSFGYGFAGTEGAIVVLRDGTLLVSFVDPADSVQYVVGYNAAGTEVYRFTIGPSADYFVEAISEALDSTSFWVLVYNSATSEIEVSNIRLSDGAVLQSWTKPDSVAYGAFAVVRVAIGALAILPLPIQPEPAPNTCTPQTQVKNGGRGNAGCNKGGVGDVLPCA